MGKTGINSFKAAKWSRKTKSKNLLDSALTVFAGFCESSYSGISEPEEGVQGEMIESARKETLERSLAWFLAV